MKIMLDSAKALSERLHVFVKALAEVILKRFGSVFARREYLAADVDVSPTP